MNITGLNGQQDINTLRKLLAQGLITEDDLSGATMSGSLGPQTAPVQGPQNAISDLVNPQDQPSSQDMRAQGQQFVRNEDTGQTMYMGPNGPSDIPYSRELKGQVPQAPQTQMPNPSAAYTGPRMMPGASQGQMRVVGSGQGQVTDLGMEPAKAVPIDYSRSQIDIPGVGRGYYGRDGNAYVANPDGSMTKVLLGYDAAGSAALTNQRLAQDKTRGEIAHTEEQIRASKVNTPDFGGQGSGAASGLTGDTFLTTLDPQMAAQVKAYADGRLPFPAGFALKSPHFQNMLLLVGQYDPSFDAANASARSATRKAFTSGPDASNVTAIETAINHMGGLFDAYKQLDNTRAPAWNYIANAAENTGLLPGSEKNQTATAAVQSHALAVAHELASVFRRTGMSNKEVDDWLNQISTSASPATANSVIANGIDLLYGRLGPLADKYNTGMGKTGDPMDLLKPGPRAVLERIQAENLTGGTPHEAVVGPSTANPASGSAFVNPGSDPLVVVAPDGSRHRFPNPRAAAAFKKAIGQ